MFLSTTGGSIQDISSPEALNTLLTSEGSILCLPTRLCWMEYYKWEKSDGNLLHTDSQSLVAIQQRALLQYTDCTAPQVAAAEEEAAGTLKEVDEEDITPVM